VPEGEWRWQRARPYALGPNRGVLRLRSDRNGQVDARRLPAVLTVTGRAAGESLRPSQGEPRRSLKELLRAAAVLPWERNHWPLLRAGGATGPIVAVVDLAIDAAYRAEAGGTPPRDRLSLVWESAPVIRVE
jgi:tRNA(Ile)-lysidine synthase